MIRNRIFVSLGIIVVLAITSSLGIPALGASMTETQPQANTPVSGPAATQTAQAIEVKALEGALTEATPTPTPAPAAEITATIPVSGTALLPTVASAHPYADNDDEVWPVSNTDANAQATRVHLARLDLEKGVDWLIVMDAQDIEVQRLTGSNPDGVWTDIVPGNLVRLRLVSDGSVAGWGLAADAFQSVPYPTFGYSSHPYPNDSDQTWQFNNLDGAAEATRLHFSRLDLEKDVDWLVVMDLTEKPYQWITGQVTNGLWSTAVPDTGVIVKLISDSSVNRWGFNVDALESALPGAAEAQPEAQPTPDKPVVESKHPYEEGRVTWTVVNSNAAAAYTKVHIARVEMKNGTVSIADGNGNLVQTFADGTNASDFWSDDVPGRVVKVYLDGGCCTKGWGLRVDRVATGVSQPALAESKHPFAEGRVTWTVVNPNAAAAYTKVHIARIEMKNGTVSIADGNGNLVQTFADGTNASDFWSDDVPGRVVKVYLDGGCCTKGWGLRLDRVATGIPQPALAESKHPYAEGVASWVIANPNPAATFTRLHFPRLQLRNGEVVLQDGAGKQVQSLPDGTDQVDFWSDPVPGRVVKVELRGGCCTKGWGLRIDDVSPKSNEKPLPAFVNGVYLHVGQPGTLWLNGVQLGKATAAGDYLVRLPELGENPMAVETLFHQQAISVTTSEDGGVRIGYNGIQPIPAPTATPAK